MEMEGRISLSLPAIRLSSDQRMNRCLECKYGSISTTRIFERRPQPHKHRRHCAELLPRRIARLHPVTRYSRPRQLNVPGGSGEFLPPWIWSSTWKNKTDSTTPVSPVPM